MASWLGGLGLGGSSASVGMDESTDESVPMHQQQSRLTAYTDMKSVQGTRGYTAELSLTDLDAGSGAGAGAGAGAGSGGGFQFSPFFLGFAASAAPPAKPRAAPAKRSNARHRDRPLNREPQSPKRRELAAAGAASGAASIDGEGDVAMTKETDWLQSLLGQTAAAGSAPATTTAAAAAAIVAEVDAAQSESDVSTADEETKRRSRTAPRKPETQRPTPERPVAEILDRMELAGIDTQRIRPLAEIAKDFPHLKRTGKTASGVGKNRLVAAASATHLAKADGKEAKAATVVKLESKTATAAATATAVKKEVKREFGGNGDFKTGVVDVEALRKDLEDEITANSTDLSEPVLFERSGDEVFTQPETTRWIKDHFSTWEVATLTSEIHGTPLNPTELMVRLKQCFAALPEFLSGYADELLQEAGTWTENGATYTFPACSQDDKCIANTRGTRMIDAKTRTVVMRKCILTSFMYESVYNTFKETGQAPRTRMRCIQCIRDFVQRAVLDVRNAQRFTVDSSSVKQESKSPTAAADAGAGSGAATGGSRVRRARRDAETDSTFLLQYFTERVDKPGGYFSDYMIAPLDDTYEGLLSAFVGYSDRSFAAVIKANGRTRIDQSAIKYKEKPQSLPSLGQPLASF